MSPRGIYTPCPICGTPFSRTTIQLHVNECVADQERKDSTKKRKAKTKVKLAPNTTINNNTKTKRRKLKTKNIVRKNALDVPKITFFQIKNEQMNRYLDTICDALTGKLNSKIPQTLENQGTEVQQEYLPTADTNTYVTTSYRRNSTKQPNHTLNIKSPPVIDLLNDSPVLYPQEKIHHTPFSLDEGTQPKEFGLNGHNLQVGDQSIHHPLHSNTGDSIGSNMHSSIFRKPGELLHCKDLDEIITVVRQQRKSKVSTKEILLFLQKLKARRDTTSTDLYQKFCCELILLRKRKITISQLMSRIASLLVHNEDLALEFSKFLPKQYSMEGLVTHQIAVRQAVMSCDAPQDQLKELCIRVMQESAPSMLYTCVKTHGGTNTEAFGLHQARNPSKLLMNGTITTASTVIPGPIKARFPQVNPPYVTQHMATTQGNYAPIPSAAIANPTENHHMTVMSTPTNVPYYGQAYPMGQPSNHGQPNQMQQQPLFQQGTYLQPYNGRNTEIHVNNPRY